MTTRTLDMANVIASDVTIAGDKTLSGDITFSGDVVPSTPLSHRNMIINGAMLVAQRGTSAVTADASYPVDRFLMLNNSNGTFSAQQVAEAPSGFKNSLKVTITGADTDLSTTQRLLVSYYIEGQDFISPAFGTSSAKSITLSFQVRSSLTGTFSGSLQNDDQDRSFIFEYTINAANTWESKSITISGETSGTWVTTNGVGARLRFSLGEGTNQQGTVNTWSNANYFGTSSGTSLIGTNGATWQITGVQLELGDNETPFEHRSFGEELQKCQRYYQKSHNYSSNPSTSTDSDDAICGNSWADGNCNFEQGFVGGPMRTSPTVVLRPRGYTTTGQVSAAGTNRSASASQISTNTVGYIAITSGSNNNYVCFTYECKAEL